MLPARFFDCPDNELVHPAYVQRYMDQLGRISGVDILDGDELIEVFFQCGQSRPAYRYAGFKSMPDRHKNYAEFIHRPDIRFITLARDDVPSTVASFITAMRTGCWRRNGEAQTNSWAFGEADMPLVLGNLNYIYTSQLMLDMVPNAIRLVYEKICDPRFRCVELDEFFGRPVKIKNPRPPLHASDYVTNWAEFETFVLTSFDRLQTLSQGPGLTP